MKRVRASGVMDPPFSFARSAPFFPQPTVCDMRLFEIRINTLLAVLSCAALAGGCAAAAPDVPASEVAAQAAPPVSLDPLTQCLEPGPQLTRFAPLELYLSATHCVRQDKLDNAVFLFGAAGSEGRYDALRVSDATARQAASFLPFLFQKELGEASFARFSGHMKAKLSDAPTRQAFCGELRQLPPPSYYPQYMVDHGLQAISASLAGKQERPGLKALPDERQAWASAVNGYMACGA